MPSLRNTITHGNCLDILPQLQSGSANFVLTDPPYVSHYQDRTGREVSGQILDTLKPAYVEMHRILEPNSFCVSFYGWSNIDRFLDAFRNAGFRTIGHIVCPKRYTSTSKYLCYQHESAFLLAKGHPRGPEYPIGDVIDWPFSGNELHPMQKPLSVLLPLVESFSRPGGIVLDPFAGSGTTCLAARMLGRDFIGIELDAKYHEIATGRLAGQAARSRSAAETDTPETHAERIRQGRASPRFR